jgi:heme exporter protein B
MSGAGNLIMSGAGKPIMSAFLALVRRDLRLSLRMGGSGALALIFFLMVTVLMPFALGPDLNLLSRIGPAILWIGALLSVLIGLDRLFQQDEEEGALDLMHLSVLPIEQVVLAKAIAHWLTTGLPLALASPLLGLLVALEEEALLRTFLALLAGTPALTFLGAVGAALSLPVRRGGLVLAVLVVPFMIPVLIFGVAASSSQGPFVEPFLILIALTLASGVIGTAGAALMLTMRE